ncbi:purine-cytosine permease family protein [Acidocella aromatica]|uniref:NCS1 family nucleobase:cation symporter-1 n=1 Tax=Acidocella aromatica TaxID=1303579 RepID=A0A840VB21_9PROT|nr:cytosine permease [Acidocella aromatica]MBB5372973.1 NCS1 family nucleobase:cation symporter-1 [Acidocella aromatica]
MTAEVTPELYGIIEEKGIAEVSPQERHGNPKAVFGLWMAANIEFATLTTGALATGWLGLSFSAALLAIVIANVLGGLVLAFFSTFGVDYGRPQMIQGANWFGELGNKLPSLLNFFGGFSWFAVNTIAGAYALQYFFGGSLIIGVVALSLVQVAIAFFGHDLIQTAEKYLVYFLTLAFLALTVVAVQHLGLSVPENVKAEAAVGGFSGAFILTVSIMVGYMVGWIPYSSDYTRYLRTETGAAGVKKTVFSYAFLGSVISTVWIEALGALLGAAVSFTKPSDLFTTWMPDWFKVPFLIAVILGTISANIINIYSATLSALAAANFITNYENFLLVLGYWTMPWIAITLLCHVTDRVSRLPVSAAFIAWVGAIAVSWPFYNQALYVGPVAAKFPQIGDSTFIVSFVAGALFYLLLSKPAKAA